MVESAGFCNADSGGLFSFVVSVMCLWGVSHLDRRCYKKNKYAEYVWIRVC